MKTYRSNTCVFIYSFLFFLLFFFFFDSVQSIHQDMFFCDPNFVQNQAFNNKRTQQLSSNDQIHVNQTGI
jgi:hypothetical protein